MSEQKYCVVYRNLPTYKGTDQYIARHIGEGMTSVASFPRLITSKREYIAAMSLAEAREVAHKWEQFDRWHASAEVAFLFDTADAVIDEEEEAPQYPEPDAIAVELRHEADRLQPDEKAALEHLAAFWNAYVALPPQSHASTLDTDRTVRDAVHAIQSCLGMRVARRVDPDFWT